MQHVLQVSRKIDYGLRAMIHLAGLPAGKIATLQDLSTTLHVPREFLAKILKVLAAKGLIRSARGVDGGGHLARAARAGAFPGGSEGAGGARRVHTRLPPHD